MVLGDAALARLSDSVRSCAERVREFSYRLSSRAAAAADPALPEGLSTSARALLGGLLSCEPDHRLSAAAALAEPWCKSDAVANHKAGATRLRRAVEAGLRSDDPAGWVGAPPADEPPPTLPVAPSREPAARVPRLEAERAPEERAEPEEAGEVGEELDAVQAEIARLKAELGV